MGLLGFSIRLVQNHGHWFLLPAWAAGRTVAWLISGQRTQKKHQQDATPKEHIEASGAESSQVVHVEGSGAGRTLMLVCDLNETLVGDDASTATFKRFWEDVGVVWGGVLVYNTGRSLQATERMLRDKSHCLPVPSALICSLGTRIYWPCDGQWEEDHAWTAAMHAGWDTDTVKQACSNIMLSDPHLGLELRSSEQFKVTCQVLCPLLEQARSKVQEALEAHNLTALTISSGQGDKRFLTLVPIKAGKLAAQEHVRQHFNVPHSSTVSCGDSGNDLLMLSGCNPAVVVGNAEPELIQWAKQQQAAQPQELGPNGQHRLYLAQGHEALGVVEGLRQLGYK